MSPVTTTMLIAYDGSRESRRAMSSAARLLNPREVEILTAWEPLHRTAARVGGMSGLRQAEWVTDTEEDDPAYARARDTCEEGVELAESLGLVARAHLVEAKTSVWSAIVDAVRVLEPDVIVTGTRNASAWKSLWQPSTAEGVLHNAGIPVFVVPPES
ncbi:universal stress protein [Corynebacterium comes]|uniref:Universal stress protein family protein n=1 Tax=Corynebacterium comes TaxID=2675218 RepID=A0A6B8W2N9_9CORY|nr:universal stress protein [Corynebacterium comes]QGU05685.1 Universal stress protein family protein [Corynebacterium comes]